jgi:hypothetical protein
MSSPLTFADLMSPVGPITAALFPGEQSNVLEARLTQYLDNGYGDERVAAQTDQSRQDMLARAWALYQAFTDVYIRLSAEPTTLAVTEKGSHAYVAEQLRNFKALADKYLSDFNGLLIIPPAVPLQRIPPTMSLRNNVEW